MQPKVLVIEDDTLMRHLIADTLGRINCEVVSAADAYQAIDLLGRERPDLVLCDIFMPGMDGYELLSFIRGQAQLSKVPVIMVSAAVSDWNQRKAEMLGADDYIMKPFKSSTLLSKVSEHLMGAEAMM